jgi:hypothetical protein
METVSHAIVLAVVVQVLKDITAGDIVKLGMLMLKNAAIIVLQLSH